MLPLELVDINGECNQLLCVCIPIQNYVPLGLSMAADEASFHQIVAFGMILLPGCMATDGGNYEDALLTFQENKVSELEKIFSFARFSRYQTLWQLK